MRRVLRVHAHIEYFQLLQLLVLHVFHKTIQSDQLSYARVYNIDEVLKSLKFASCIERNSVVYCMIMLSIQEIVESRTTSVVDLRATRGDKSSSLALELKKHGGKKNSREISKKHVEKIQRRRTRIERKGEIGLPRPSRFSR